MWRWIFFFVVITLIARWLFRSDKKKMRSGRPYKRPPGSVEEMKKDPVCGTYVPVSQALTVNSGGQTHYFCSPACRDKFLSR